MKVSSFLRRLAACRSGSTVVETAFCMPLVLFMLLGVMKLGEVMYARNAINHAVEEASRYATIYPTPTDAEIKARFRLRGLGFIPKAVTATVTRTQYSATVKSIEVKAKWNYTVDLVVMRLGPFNIGAKRRVFTAT